MGAIGTVNRNLSIEALSFNFYNFSSAIQYQVHVRNEGWHSWKANGAIAGTTGKVRPIEALKITTTGTYGVSYRVHAQNYGWLAFVDSGATRMWGNFAGTVGEARHIEAVQFYVYQQSI